MDLTLLQKKAREILELRTNPNRCWNCLKVHAQLQDMAVYGTYVTGERAGCSFPVCAECYTNGAPICRDMMDVACEWAHLYPAASTRIDEEKANLLVMFAYHHREYAAALRGTTPDKAVN